MLPKLTAFTKVAKTYSAADVKIAILNNVKKTSLEYTAVINRFFLYHCVVLHVESYLSGLTLAIDIANKVTGITGSGDVPVVFAYSFDIGESVAAFLD